MKVATAPKLDQIDLKLLREMVASAAFQTVRLRTLAELNRALQTCERSDVPIDVWRAQGAVAALRTVLGMPQKIMTEIENDG